MITGPGIADEALSLLDNNDIEVLRVLPEVTTPDIVDLVSSTQPDGFIIRTNQINQAVINASEKLRIIVKHGVGVNNIDVEAATNRAIPVLITRGANSRSVAEHALTLILALQKNVQRFSTGIRAGKWERAGYQGGELTGKHLGLVGMGNISRELIELVQPFRMQITFFDPYATDDQPGIERATSLENMLANVDVLSIHCPLTPETKNLIGAQQLASMKPSAIIVNTARGGIINEADLAQSLRNGTISGAGLDSFEQEPPQGDHPLWEFSNVISTPHIAGATAESMVRMGTTAAQHIIDYLHQNTVDRDSTLNPKVL